jgi:hypothetical protein
LGFPDYLPLLNLANTLLNLASEKNQKAHDNTRTDANQKQH